MQFATFMLKSAAVVGICLSLYALYVEHQVASSLSYSAACDINDRMSCSKVFTSKYGKLLSYFELLPEGHVLDIPNAGLGLLFYGAALAHDRIPGVSPSLAAYSMAAAAVGAAATSVYLGWVLTTQLQDFCIVCASTYVVNLIMLMMAVQQVMTVQHASLPKHKSA